MTGKNPPGGPEAGKAAHGARSEVTWKHGEGRQPYANQGREEAAQPSGGDEFSEGDRGELSGRNLEHEQAKEGSLDAQVRTRRTASATG